MLWLNSYVICKPSGKGISFFKLVAIFNSKSMMQSYNLMLHRHLIRGESSNDAMCVHKLVAVWKLKLKALSLA